MRQGHGGHTGRAAAWHQHLATYTDANPLNAVEFGDKVKLLAAIDAYARAKDPRIRQVSCSLMGEWRAVQIIRPDGIRVGDIRPLVRLSVSVVVGDGDRLETGSSGAGGRTGYQAYIDPAHWQAQVDEALHEALGQSRLDTGTGRPGY